jgi:hypothetical protein
MDTCVMDGCVSSIICCIAIVSDHYLRINAIVLLTHRLLFVSSWCVVGLSVC